MNKTDIQISSNKIIKDFFIIFLIIGSIITGSITVAYKYETIESQNKIQNDEFISIKLYENNIKTALNGVISDLRILSQLNKLHSYLSSDKPEHATNFIAREMILFAKEKKHYDQLRYIDNTGMEIVRINYNNGLPVIVAKDKLQDKSKRYYFTDTIKLKRGEIFISPFDLNVEKGEIEVPFKPMIRIGTPVYDEVGNKKGIILLNLYGDKILNIIENIKSNSIGTPMLVNKNGYWLYNTNKGKLWGFMLPDRKDLNFQHEAPKVWENIINKENGQVVSKKGVFTFATIRPVDNKLFTSGGCQKAYGSSKKVEKSDKYFWKMVLKISPYEMSKITSNFLWKMFYLGAFLFVLSSIPAWLIAQAIVRRRLHKEELLKNANYDLLTGLPNRNLFYDRLQNTTALSDRNKKPFYVIFIDLDGFKQVNDIYGHNIGDILLRDVANRLKACTRKSDTVARMGGDEFVAILPETNDKKGAEIVAGKIIKDLNKVFNINNLKIEIGASLGVAKYPDNGKNIDDLLKNADNAMYASKNKGKNCYTFAKNESPINCVM